MPQDSFEIGNQSKLGKGEFISPEWFRFPAIVLKNCFFLNPKFSNQPYLNRFYPEELLSDK